MQPIDPITKSNIVSQYSTNYNIAPGRNETKTVQYIEQMGRTFVEVTYKTYNRYGEVIEHKPPTIDIKA